MSPYIAMNSLKPRSYTPTQYKLRTLINFFSQFNEEVFKFYFKPCEVLELYKKYESKWMIANATFTIVRGLKFVRVIIITISLINFLRTSYLSSMFLLEKVINNINEF